MTPAFRFIYIGNIGFGDISLCFRNVFSKAARNGLFKEPRPNTRKDAPEALHRRFMSS